MTGRLRSSHTKHFRLLCLLISVPFHSEVIDEVLKIVIERTNDLNGVSEVKEVVSADENFISAIDWNRLYGRVETEPVDIDIRMQRVIARLLQISTLYSAEGERASHSKAMVSVAKALEDEFC